MSDAFARAFAVIIGNEGGYTDDAADPGGATKWGISHAAYPDLDIASLTLADAQAIYLRDYWIPIRGDDLPPALALLVFDAAVNNGVSRAVKWLQFAVDAVADGVLGDATMAAVRATVAHTSVIALCGEFMAQRLVFMTSLPTWRTFGLGWARRLCGLPYAAAALALEMPTA